MQVYFTVNVGRKFRDSSWCPLNRGCPLNTGFTVLECLINDGGDPMYNAR